MKCQYKYCSNDLTGRQSKWCSRNCQNKYNVIKNRRTNKRRAVEYKGGKCERCGYDKCVAALHFHHLDPATKLFGIAQSGWGRSWTQIQREIEKCMLVCANCHAEIEHSWVR